MRRLIIVAIALLNSLGSSQVNADHRSHELVFGSVAMDIPAEMHKRLLPLTRHLSDTLQMPVRLRLSPNMKSAIAQLAKGDVDVAYLTPVAYLEAHRLGDARLLVKTITNGQGAFRLMIVARDDSSITSPAQLKGHSFAFGDRKALLQRAVVRAAGVELRDLGEYAFLGHYDNIARGVIAGDFDAGILKDTKAYAWQGKGLKVIHASAPLPPYNIAARAGLDPALAERIREAFLALNPDIPGDAAVIRTLSRNYNGFAATSDAEYDVVRELIRPFRSTAAGSER